MNNSKFGFLPVHFRHVLDLLGRQWLFRAVAVVAIVFLAAFIFSLVSPAAGEAWIYNQVYLSIIMTATFAGLVSMLVLGFATLFASWCISLAFRFAKNDIAITMENARKNAPPALGAWNIYPDIAVFQNLDESEIEFERRVSEARTRVTDSVWVVAVAFRTLAVRVDDNTPKGFFVDRAGEGSFSPHRNDAEIKIETEQEYNLWLSDFCLCWPPYSEREKITRTKGSVFAKPISSAINVAVLLLLSVASYGQNTAKIHNALGANDTEVSSGTVVNYVFTGGQSAMRTADKATTISSLFVNGRAGLESLNVGELEGVAVNGKAIELQKKTIPATGKPDKPAALYADAGSAQPIKTRSFTESIPDSITIVNGLNEVKNRLPFYKSKFYQIIAPLIEFLSYTFLFLSPLFAIALGFFNLISRSARQNGNLGESVRVQQVRFAAFAWWTSVLLVGSVYLCTAFTMFFWEFHPALITALCFGAFYPAKWAINRLTPNGEYQGSMTVTRNVGGGGRSRELGM